MSVAELLCASEAHRAQTVESRRRRPPPGCRKALPPRRKPLYEPLELRLLLASDRFSFLAAADVPIDLTLPLDHATQILQLIDQHEQSWLARCWQRRAVNAIIKWGKKTTRWFRNTEHFTTAILFHCRGFDLYPHQSRQGQRYLASLRTEYG